jgi:hypothetical protein
MGESREAFLAGQKPKIMPTVAEKVNAKAMDCGATIAAHPAKIESDRDIPTPRIIPIMPPRVESTADSIRN